ncbi:MAG TPA: hypothetical protein VNW52_01190 [Burkholderiaceae bacterium]|jgi:hypothetical protein|nr:hypothetical protein [Burkholderiaceae bacterium]
MDAHFARQFENKFKLFYSGATKNIDLTISMCLEKKKLAYGNVWTMQWNYFGIAAGLLRGKFIGSVAQRLLPHDS